MSPGTRVGAHVALHLFEPRYKILIRRAWEGNRLFVYCGASPATAQRGIIVRVDHARFLPDGRANIVGTGVRYITLERAWVEEGTGGLWYTKVTDGVHAIVPRDAVSLPRERPATGGQCACSIM